MKPEEDIRAFARRQARTLLKKLAGEIVRTAGEPDADAIHDLRVAIRRVSQCLSIFAPLYPKGEAKAIRKRLAAVRKLAGAVRDRDIAIEYLGESAAAGAPDLIPVLATEREEELRQVAVRVHRWQAKESWKNWRRRLRAKSGSRGEGVAPWDLARPAAANAAAVLPSLAASFFLAGRALTETGAPERFHELRILGKRLRYTLELFAPLYGPSGERRLATLREIQQALGEINDCVTMLALLPVKPDTPVMREIATRRDTLMREFADLWNNKFDRPGERARWMRGLSRPLAPAAKAVTAAAV
ncbi:MAG: CHAD domain-containing protein [Bryobacterales bacterium]|nr:CHAD domain-containing protein [Bryobacterales bacterium]